MINKQTRKTLKGYGMHFCTGIVHVQIENVDILCIYTWENLVVPFHSPGKFAWYSIEKMNQDILSMRVSKTRKVGVISYIKQGYIWMTSNPSKGFWNQIRKYWKWDTSFIPGFQWKVSILWWCISLLTGYSNYAR